MDTSSTNTLGIMWAIDDGSKNFGLVWRVTGLIHLHGAVDRGGIIVWRARNVHFHFHVLEHDGVSDGKQNQTS